MKHRVAVLALVLLTSAVCAESVYKWIDKSGIVHFSDQPQVGAQQIKIKDSPSDTPSPDATAQDIAPPAPTSTSSTMLPAAHTYSVVKLTQPMSDQTIRNNDGAVIVQVSMDPQLQEGDKVQLIMDSQPMGDPQGSTSLSLTNVDRGSHSVSARIVDATGNTLLESDTITFNMQRPRIMKHN